jgi:hypothetical protein
MPEVFVSFSDEDHEAAKSAITKSASREWSGPQPAPEAVQPPVYGFRVTPAEC